jgi:hypothetical protein
VTNSHFKTGEKNEANSLPLSLKENKNTTINNFITFPKLVIKIASKKDNFNTLGKAKT